MAGLVAEAVEVALVGVVGVTGVARLLGAVDMELVDTPKVDAPLDAVAEVAEVEAPVEVFVVVRNGV